LSAIEVVEIEGDVDVEGEKKNRWDDIVEDLKGDEDPDDAHPQSTNIMCCDNSVTVLLLAWWQ
jgi:hypothetical protein